MQLPKSVTSREKRVIGDLVAAQASSESAEGHAGKSAERQTTKEAEAQVLQACHGNLLLLGVNASGLIKTGLN